MSINEKNKRNKKQQRMALLQEKMELYREIEIGELTADTEMISRVKEMDPLVLGEFAVLFGEIEGAEYASVAARSLMRIVRKIYLSLGEALPVESFYLFLEYIIIKYAPPTLPECLSFMEKPGEQSSHREEELQYYVCAFRCALHAIERLEFDAMHMSGERYNELMARYIDKKRRSEPKTPALLKRAVNFLHNGWGK
jgi:hypothetical protein